MKIAITTLFCICACQAHAMADSNDLTRYLGDQILAAQSAVVSHAPASQGNTFELNTIQIELSPTAKFGISSVVSLTVSPVIDFTFEK